jgi:hypothetical protein
MGCRVGAVSCHATVSMLRPWLASTTILARDICELRVARHFHGASISSGFVIVSLASWMLIRSRMR